MPPKRKASRQTEDVPATTSNTTTRLQSLRALAYNPPQSNTTPAPSSSRATQPKPTPPKKRSRHSGYAPPTKYAHLSGIPDVLAPNLILVFVGTNPGLLTAATGHAYSSPSNHFWRLLHTSGLTPDMKRPPTDDLKLPELYSMGCTNLVSRPTKDQAELSPAEMEAEVPVLEGKVRKWKPEAVCIVGKGIWERIYRVKEGGRLGREFKFGWQEGSRLGADREWEGARVFVALSTSGLVAGYSPKQKLDIMSVVGKWVNLRRGERGETAPRGLPAEVVEEKAREREEEFRRGLREWEEEEEAKRAGEVKAEDKALEANLEEETAKEDIAGEDSPADVKVEDGVEFGKA